MIGDFAILNNIFFGLLKIIDHENFIVFPGSRLIDKMGANIAGTAGNKDSFGHICRFNRLTF